MLEIVRERKSSPDTGTHWSLSSRKEVLQRKEGKTREHLRKTPGERPLPGGKSFTRSKASA